jgi:hypothetical protein
MSTSDTGLIMVGGAILAVTITLAVASMGQAPPSVLAACAQALQALARALLWLLGQHNQPDDRK